MIRKYKETDIPQLMLIWENAATIAHPFLSDDFNAMVKQAMREMYLPNSNTWVYEENGEIIGFISMLENEIGGLFVNPEKQAKGIGTALVNFINQSHNELEVEVFELNKIGRPFYEKMGFKLMKEYHHEPSSQTVLRLKKAS